MSGDKMNTWDKIMAAMIFILAASWLVAVGIISYAALEAIRQAS